MKIFEFRNSFIVLDEIRSVIINPMPHNTGMIINSDEENDSERWYIRIIYKDESSFKSYFASESDARQAYSKLMNAIKHLEEDSE